MRRASLLAVVAILLGGCGTGGRERDIRAAATGFVVAVDRRDGTTACRLLTPDARQQVESSAGKPCRRAILSSSVGRPPVARVETYIISGFVGLDDGERLYLDQTPLGWRVSAAGCRPPGGTSPDECEVG